MPGVHEVLHARFGTHAYPSHTHETWTLLVVDDGAVRFALDRREHATQRSRVTLLPPHVPHDGRAASPGGFRKRVVYLDEGVLGTRRTGRAADHPEWHDPVLRAEVSRLHRALAEPGSVLESEERLTVVTARLLAHLDGVDPHPGEPPDRRLAHRLKQLLDERVVEGIGLAEAAVVLDSTPTHLVRAFRRELGIAPHRYLTGRRLDRARRLLLAGARPADVACAVGFYDQSHLARHFTRLLGIPPGAYAASGRA